MCSGHKHTVKFVNFYNYGRSPGKDGVGENYKKT